jgi:hypothetical protein
MLGADIIVAKPGGLVPAYSMALRASSVNISFIFVYHPVY